MNIPSAMRARIYAKQGGKCLDCGRASLSGKYGQWNPTTKKPGFIAEGMEFHHVVKYRITRKHEEHNIVMLCQICHIVRHDGVPDKTIKKLIDGLTAMELSAC